MVNVWRMWIPSVFLRGGGGERTKGALGGSWVKLLGGQRRSTACLLSNSVCQPQQHSCFLLRTDSACSVHVCEERHFQTFRYNGVFTHLKPSYICPWGTIERMPAAQTCPEMIMEVDSVDLSWMRANSLATRETASSQERADFCSYHSGW